MGHILMTIILSDFNRKIPIHLAYVATLPCETLMSAKQAINEKLQGIVATVGFRHVQNEFIL